MLFLGRIKLTDSTLRQIIEMFSKRSSHSDFRVRSSLRRNQGDGRRFKRSPDHPRLTKAVRSPDAGEPCFEKQDATNRKCPPSFAAVGAVHVNDFEEAS